jgi:hypothetical protein
MAGLIGNLGKIPASANQSNKCAVMRAASEIITSREYFKNWFNADDYFGSEYVSGILKRIHFITCDHWMSGRIFSIRKMSPHGIDNVSGPFDSLEDAKQFLKGVK